MNGCLALSKLNEPAGSVAAEPVRIWLFQGEKKMNKKRAFTLIELLVVIAVIAILLSIILPALSKAKEIARMMVCGTNEKSLVMASKLWADDNDNFAIAAKWWRDPLHEFENGDTEDNSACSLMPYLDSSRKREKDSLTCPSAMNVDFFAKNPDVYNTEGQEKRFTYAANGYMIFNYCVSPGEIIGPLCGAPAYNGPEGPDNIHWNIHGSTKLSSIRNPARVAYFIDHEYYFVARWFFDPTVPPDRISGLSEEFWFQTRWHKKRHTDPYGIGMIGWVDGHVSREPKDFAEIVENNNSKRRWTMYFYGQ